MTDSSQPKSIPGEPYYPDSSFDFDYPPERPVACKGCGWSGVWRDARVTDLSRLAYWVVVCPACSIKFAILSIGVPEQIFSEAERGNPNAIALLGAARIEQDRLDAYEAKLVKDNTAFPKITGDGKIKFIWDFEGFWAPAEEDEPWNVIRVARTGEEICREPAFYEVKERFKFIRELLRQRYGKRFQSLTPTRRSWMWLFGDDISASHDCRVKRSALAKEAPWAEN